MTELEFSKLKTGMKVYLLPLKTLINRGVIIPNYDGHKFYDTKEHTGINKSMLSSFGKIVTISFIRGKYIEIEEDNINDRYWVYPFSWIGNIWEKPQIKLSFDDLFSGNFEPILENTETN